MASAKRGSADLVGSYVRANPIGSMSFAFDVGMLAAMIFKLLKNRDISAAKILDLVPLVPLVPADTPARRPATRRTKTAKRSRKAA